MWFRGKKLTFKKPGASRGGTRWRNEVASLSLPFLPGGGGREGGGPDVTFHVPTMVASCVSAVARDSKAYTVSRGTRNHVATTANSRRPHEEELARRNFTFTYVASRVATLISSSLFPRQAVPCRVTFSFLSATTTAEAVCFLSLPSARTPDVVTCCRNYELIR